MRVRYSIFLIFLLVIITDTSLASQVNQINSRPNLILKEENLSSSGQIILGFDNDSNIQLYSSLLTTNRERTKIQGDTTIQKIDNTVLIQGNFSFEKISSKRVVGSFYQKQVYDQDFLPREKNVIDKSNTVIILGEILINRTTKILPGFSFFNNNNNYRKVVSNQPAITAFIKQDGNLKSVDLNNTQGIKTGRIFAFKLEVKVFLYRNSDRQFIGVFQTVDTGFGNILPKQVIDYLKNQRFTKNIDKTVIGAKLLQSYNLSNIEWINLGKNETLGLELQSAIYRFNRQSVSLFLTDQGGLQSLSLSGVAEDVEQYTEELVSQNAINSFDIEALDIFEETISKEILDPVVVADPVDVISSEGKSTINKELFFYAQITSLLILTVILIRKKKNTKR